MLKASKELQFEQAARLRDEILRLKAQLLILSCIYITLQ